MAFIKVDWSDISKSNPTSLFRKVIGQGRANIRPIYDGRVYTDGLCVEFGNIYIKENEAKKIYAGRMKQVSAVYKLIKRRSATYGDGNGAFLMKIIGDETLVEDISNRVISDAKKAASIRKKREKYGSSPYAPSRDVGCRRINCSPTLDRLDSLPTQPTTLEEELEEEELEEHDNHEVDNPEASFFQGLYET